jgi:FADH2 O2-dependent halogenase
LVQKLKEEGIDYFDRTKIIAVEKGDFWQFDTISNDTPLSFKSNFLIDATGSGKLLDEFLQIKSSSDEFITDSFAVFSHFNNIKRWVDMLKETDISTGDFPYDPDNSATHHLLDEGWIWVLRFNNGCTSMGMVLDSRKYPAGNQSAQEIWNTIAKKYPSINDMLTPASFASQPGKILKSPRLQRRSASCYGPGWVALPHTVGFIDPLFSSGIAHSLCGIEKVTNALGKYWGDQWLLDEKLKDYERAVFEELKLTDKLVGGCYKSLQHFELFNAWSMLYFAATISYEQRRLKGEQPEYFLSADDPYIRDIVDRSYHDLLKITGNDHPDPDEIAWFTDQIRERIKPVNIAGLLDPSSKNMYRHTVAVL